MFVDIHLHTIDRKGLPVDSSGDHYATARELIDRMDETGVQRGVLLPMVSPECRTRYSPTEMILEVVERHPDRFYAFCNIDPRAESNSPDADLSRQLMYYRGLGCRGIGEVTANLGFDDPLVLNLLEHAQACRMPVLFHIAPARYNTYGLIDDLHLPRLERCLKMFPRLAFIGHSPPFWSEISGDVTDEDRCGYPDGTIAPGGRLLHLLRTCPNLYGDISARSGYNALTRDPRFGYAFLEEFSDRLLFGTDICSPNNRHEHAAFLRRAREEGHISSDAVENIAWGNANRILDLGLSHADHQPTGGRGEHGGNDAENGHPG